MAPRFKVSSERLEKQGWGEGADLATPGLVQDSSKLSTVQQVIHYICTYM